MTTAFYAKPYGTFIKIKSIFREKKLHRTHQCSNFFLETGLAIETIKEPQSHLEEKENRSILEDDISSRKDPSIGSSNYTSRVFPVLKSTSQFLPQSTVSARSDSN